MFLKQVMRTGRCHLRNTLHLVCINILVGYGGMQEVWREHRSSVRVQGIAESNFRFLRLARRSIPKISESSFSHSLIFGDFIESTNASVKNLSLKRSEHVIVHMGDHLPILGLKILQFFTVMPILHLCNAYCVPCEMKHCINN